MSRKVLALVHGELSSHTVRIVAICKALAKTGGYEISFSGNGPYMQLAKDAGFNCIETPTVNKRHIFDEFNRTLAPVVFNRDNFEYFFSEENKLLKRHRPDIIIRDHFRELAAIVAKQKENRAYDISIQKASISPYYHFDFRPDSLPKWVHLFPTGSLKPFIRLFENYYRKRNSKYIRRKLKKLGLNHFLSIEGVNADLTLFPDAEELFPLPKADREKNKHIGPILLSNHNTQPEWLDKYQKDTRKKIIISNGTTGEYEHIKFFSETFRNKNFAIAFHSSDNRQVNDFYGCNEFSLPSVLPHADLFITHGGTGSSYLGLKHKVPMLVLHNHFEQHVNAVELEKQHVALQLGAKNRTPKKIIKLTNRILSNGHYKKNIAKLANKISFNDSTTLAVKYISKGYKDFRKTTTK